MARAKKNDAPKPVRTDGKAFKDADPADNILPAGVVVNPADPAQGYQSHLLAKLGSVAREQH